MWWSFCYFDNLIFLKGGKMKSNFKEFNKTGEQRIIKDFVCIVCSKQNILNKGSAWECGECGAKTKEVHLYFRPIPFNL